MIKNIFEFNNDYVNGTYNSINLKHKSKAIKGFEDFSMSNRVSWTGPDEQNDRFKELLKIGVSNGDTILDFGCGLGALYGYTRKNKLNVKYIGVDINDNYIKDAKKYYNVKLKNIMNFGFNDIKFYTINDYNDIKERFDWFLSSGSFTLGFTRMKL